MKNIIVLLIASLATLSVGKPVIIKPQSNIRPVVVSTKAEVVITPPAPVEAPKPPVVAPEPTPVSIAPPPAPVVVAPVSTGSHQDLMTQAGIPPSDWVFVDYIVSKESGWRHTAVNASSGATGLCQSLPASKMASAGADYLTNPVTQLKWCNGYAKSRYNGWAGSYNFWLIRHWW